MMLKRFCIGMAWLVLCGHVARAQTSDSTKVDSLSKTRPYQGYATWKEYLQHQDSIPGIGSKQALELLWFTWGLGSTSALPYQFADWAIVAQFTYERNNLLYRLRYLGAWDYQYPNNSESFDEVDALAGIGWSTLILVNASMGIGLRHRFHYLVDPYSAPSPPHVERYYFAVPIQAEVVIPLATTFGQTFGVGLEYYATWTSEAIDRGFLVTFHVGRLTGSEYGPPVQPRM